jgi:ParB family transcriptional regulator, chromosome partitioning protein
MIDPPGSQVIQMIPIHLIDVINPRDRNRKIFKEFVSNIAKVGLKRPITVARRVKADGTRYDLVCGQGRLQAFQILGQTEIPAIVIAADPQKGLLMSLVENIARCPYRPVEQLQDVAALKNRGYSEADIAMKIGVSVEYTRGILHLLDVGEHRLLRAVDAGQIPVSVAIDIAAANQSEIQHILQQAYEQNLLRGRRFGRRKAPVGSASPKGQRPFREAPAHNALQPIRTVEDLRGGYRTQKTPRPKGRNHKRMSNIHRRGTPSTTARPFVHGAAQGRGARVNSQEPRFEDRFGGGIRLSHERAIDRSSEDWF